MANAFGPVISIPGILTPWYGKPVLPAGKERIVSYKSPVLSSEKISGDGIVVKEGVAVAMVGVEVTMELFWTICSGFEVCDDVWQELKRIAVKSITGKNKYLFDMHPPIIFSD